MAPYRSSPKSSSKYSIGNNPTRSRPTNAKKKPPKQTAVRPAVQQKTKSKLGLVKRKHRTYTDLELDLPKFNMTAPAGVVQPKGKEKGKVFVDDQESMLAILAVVNASKDGQIESKMMKARRLEEIREARRKEAEARQEQRFSKLEETKDSLRRRRERKAGNDSNDAASRKEDSENFTKIRRKHVSFA